MLLRHDRQLRTDQLELSDSYSEVLDEGLVSSDDDSLESDFNDTIPEVDVQDMIELASQIVGNDLNDPARVRLRVTAHPSQRDVEMARDIILEHEHGSRFRLTTDDRRALGVGGRLDDRPFWMEIVDFVTVSVFFIALLRLVRHALSLTSFSTDILQDTIEYIDRSSQGKTAAVQAPAANNSSLLMKFGQVIDQEFPTMGRPWKMAMTLGTFYPYTIISSSLLIASFIFSIFCLTLSVGKRWHNIQQFVISVLKDGENCI